MAPYISYTILLLFIITDQLVVQVEQSVGFVCVCPKDIFGTNKRQDTLQVMFDGRGHRSTVQGPRGNSQEKNIFNIFSNA